MVQPEIYVSLDIGTTSVKVVVAEYINQQINIIGVGSERSEGLSRGVIVDIDKTVYAIQSAIHQAEQKSNYKIEEVIVGVPTNQINIEPCYGMIAVANDNREITDKDVINVLSAAKVRAVPPEREIISVIPEEFIVDGFDGIKDPRGMIGVRLELYASMITGPKTVIHNIRRCISKAGVQIKDIVVQPLANAAVAMSEGERDFGTILIDMGGGQTSASVMHENQLKFSYVDQEGGEYVSKDISTILNTTLDNAERIKCDYGYALSLDASEDEFFPVETIGKKEPVRISERYLSEIIEARLAQIFENLKKALEQVEAFELPGGIIITGGAASLPGAIDLAEEVIGHEVSFYIPEHFGLRNPMYTTAIGLIEYVANLDDIYHVAQGRQQTSVEASSIKKEATKVVKNTQKSEPKRTLFDDNFEKNNLNKTENSAARPQLKQENITHPVDSVPRTNKGGHTAENNNNDEESLGQKVKDFFNEIFN